MENSIGLKRIKLPVFGLSNLEQRRVDVKLIMLVVKLSMVWLLFLYHHNLSRGVEIAKFHTCPGTSRRPKCTCPMKILLVLK